MKAANCKFLLLNVREGEIADENGYDVFQPTVGLEIFGQNVFKVFGVEGANIVVIMHFLETALRQTQRMINDITRQNDGEYYFDLYGSGFVIRLDRHGDTIDVILYVAYQLASMQGTLEGPRTRQVGRISVRDWVEAVVDLAEDLNGRFKRLNPRIYAFLEDNDSRRRELELWISSAQN